MTTPCDPGHDLPPALDGWKVDLDSRGVWIATRRGTLSAAQMRYGVPLQVLGSTIGELEVKAIAADVHAAMVATAERLAEGMAAHPWREGKPTADGAQADG